MIFKIPNVFMFVSIIIPTNGVLMAMLGMAGIPLEKWLRFVLPLFLIMMSIAGLTNFSKKDLF